MQCVVCGKWKRLHTKSPQPPHALCQTFFGGCSYSGGDHLAGKLDDNDVCELCCHIACKAIAENPPQEATESPMRAFKVIDTTLNTKGAPARPGDVLKTVWRGSTMVGAVAYIGTHPDRQKVEEGLFHIDGPEDDC